MSESVFCLIPARGGSKRIPRKNIIDFAGKPMLAHTVEAAVDAELFEQVIVSTEDQEIAEVARKYGAEVPAFRPEALATDEARVVDVCQYMIGELEKKKKNYDVMCVLLPSAPLRSAEDILGTYNKFKNSNANHAMAVTSYYYPPWQALTEEKGYLKPYWGKKIINKKSQQIPELKVDSGSVYFTRVSAFKRENSFYGKKLVGYYVPFERAIDIDEPFQLELARVLAEKMKQ